MKIKGVSIIEIEIDKDEERRITINKLRSLVDWEDHHWVDLKTNLFMKKNSYNGSHSWSEDKSLREANDLEMAVQKIIHALVAKV